MINKKLILIFIILILLVMPFVFAATTTSSYSVNSSHTGLAGENASTASYTFRSTIPYQQITSNFSTVTYKGDSGFLETYTSCGDGTCNNGENCSSCVADCGACATESTTTTISGGGVPTYTVSAEQFKEGYTKSVGKGWKIKFDVENETHTLKIDDLTNSTIKIIISSEPQEATLAIGDERRFELNNDSFYDLYVKLNSIENKKANLTIQSINETITPETIEEEEGKEGFAEEIFDEEKNNWVFIFGLFLLIVIIVYYFYRKKE